MRLVRPTLLLALYIAFVVAVLPSYFLSYPLPEFLSRLKALLSAIYLVAACWSLGSYAVKLIIDRTSSERMYSNSVMFCALSTWLGFGMLGTIVAVLGWAVPGSLSIKLSGLNALLAAGLFWRIKTNPPVFKRMEANFSLGELACLVFAGAGILLAFVGCFSPITYYDSLVYHLALPHLYNQMSKIVPVSSNLYSYFPANIEMIFLFVMNQFAEPEYVINLWGWGSTLILTAGVMAWAHGLGGKRQALLSLLLLWTMPAVLLLSIGAYVDMPLAAFVFFAVWIFYQARSEQNTDRWIVLSGLFCGYAIATKYTGAISALILGAFLLWQVFVRRESSAKRIAFFALAALLPPSVWLLKNWISVGNPFFPFFYKWMGSGGAWTQANAAGYFSQLTDYDFKSNLLYELLLSPWNLSTGALHYGGGFDVLGDFGWPLVLLAAFPAFWIVKKNSALRFIAAYAAGHFLFWFYTKPVFRFLIALLPLMVLLASFALSMGTRLDQRKLRPLVVLLVLPWFLSNFFMYFFIANGVQPFSVALGTESRDRYLSRRLTYYDAFQFLNEHASGSEKALLIGEQRTYHLNVPYLSSNLFAPSPIADVCNKAVSVDEIVGFCKEKQLGFLLINKGEIDRLGGLGRFGFTGQGTVRFNEFIAQNTELAMEKRAVKLARIRT